MSVKWEDMLAGSGEIRRIAEMFQSYWPVFKAQELRRLGVIAHWQGDRSRTTDHYLRAGARQLSPDCWLRHHEAREDIPLDFPHTAVALYRVRCNLFHGDKAPHSEVDRVLGLCGIQVACGVSPAPSQFQIISVHLYQGRPSRNKPHELFYSSDCRSLL